MGMRPVFVLCCSLASAAGTPAGTAEDVPALAWDLVWERVAPESGP